MVLARNSFVRTKRVWRAAIDLFFGTGHLSAAEPGINVITRPCKHRPAATCTGAIASAGLIHEHYRAAACMNAVLTPVTLGV